MAFADKNGTILLALRHGDMLVNNADCPVALAMKHMRDAGILQVLFR
jgi:hypothetical protein